MSYPQKLIAERDEQSERDLRQEKKLKPELK